MDSIDLRILDALQKDASQSVSAIAEHAGISTAPCWRRIQKLENEGIITKRVALLDRTRLNAGVTVFVAVRTSKHTVEWLEKFRKAVRPGDQLMIQVKMTKSRGNRIGVAEGECTVNGQVVSSAELMFTVLDSSEFE